MLEHELYSLFLQRLNETGIHYMVTGSVASIVYGQPRLTHDIDFVVDLATSDLQRLSTVFPASEFYCRQ